MPYSFKTPTQSGTLTVRTALYQSNYITRYAPPLSSLCRRRSA